MNQNSSQCLKRCCQYGTSSGTLKRPFTASLSATATDNNDSDPQHFHDLFRGNSADEKNTASSESFSLTPCGSSGTNFSNTPRNTGGHLENSISTECYASRPLEELRQRRMQLRNSIASKEQTLRNLNLVKLHQAKVC